MEKRVECDVPLSRVTCSATACSATHAQLMLGLTISAYVLARADEVIE
jgi:hypothetical protein